MKRLILAIIASTLMMSCAIKSDNKLILTVSIDPLAWIARSLVDTTVEVKVLVPAGSSPETYEPTARQIEELSRSTLYLSTGLLDFEQELGSRLSSIAPTTRLINLSDSVTVMVGSCSHVEHRNHSHGVDPHIWLSPKAMKKMIIKAAEAIAQAGINDKNEVLARRDSLLGVVDEVDLYITSKLTESKSFAIVHPSLSYFAADYGLRQIALEIDGKEPSAATIRMIVDELQTENIATIFYGAQTSDAVAQVVASEIGCSLTPFDPLAANWSEAMKKVTDQIYGAH